MDVAAALRAVVEALVATKPSKDFFAAGVAAAVRAVVYAPKRSEEKQNEHALPTPLADDRLSPGGPVVTVVGEGKRRRRRLARQRRRAKQLSSASVKENEAAMFVDSLPSVDELVGPSSPPKRTLPTVSSERDAVNKALLQGGFASIALARTGPVCNIREMRVPFG